ncbi:hypothetical protein FISHEDRAFT_61773 [Fistulina hepatica ATCC 64428]|uniref:Uncharacterized protein n=1 Tax=Fistulina hepatica ATCC 64428 TaxID=1128425 RepID=A0A0D7A1K3_9AGAR|nr:hypothetical protein FISHEDRAFT_61773 [Fistulina hepatica ATCC 64428]
MASDMGETAGGDAREGDSKEGLDGTVREDCGGKDMASDIVMGETAGGDARKGDSEGGLDGTVREDCGGKDTALGVAMGEIAGGDAHEGDSKPNETMACCKAVFLRNLNGHVLDMPECSAKSPATSHVFLASIVAGSHNDSQDSQGRDAVS